MQNGTVIRADYSSAPGGADSDGAGNWIMIKFDNGSGQLVEHLSSEAIQPGDRVRLGDVIGRTGNTGSSEGPHLHNTFLTRDFDFEHGFPSRTEPLGELTDDTDNPVDYYPTSSQVEKWNNTHRDKSLGELALDGLELAGEAYSEIGLDDLANTSPVLQPEAANSHEEDQDDGTGQSEEQHSDSHTENHSSANGHESGHEESSEWNPQERLQERLGPPPQQSAFSHIQADDSAD
jgi:hypothetical protein